MRYRNRKTGVVIDVPSALGGLWEPVEKRSVKTAPPPVPVAEAVEEPKKTPVRKRTSRKKKTE
jgi:hypothetical protein